MCIVNPVCTSGERTVSTHIYKAFLHFFCHTWDFILGKFLQMNFAYDSVGVWMKRDERCWQCHAYKCNQPTVCMLLSLFLFSTIFSIHRNCIQFQKFYSNTYKSGKYIYNINDIGRWRRRQRWQCYIDINNIKIDMIILRTIEQQNFFTEFINSFQFN